MQKLTFAEIKPFIRFVHKFRLDETNIIENKKGYDHRLFYILGGKGRFIIEGSNIEAEKGMAIIIPSSTEYSIIPDSGEFIEALGVNYDYLQNHAHIKEPVFPIYTYYEEKRLENLHFTDYTQLNSPIVVSEIGIIEERLLNMLLEYEKAFIFMEQKLSAIFMDVFTEILRTYILQKNRVRQTEQRAEEILSYLRSHYREEITGDSLSKKFGYHKNHINYLVKLKTGTSVHRYLLNYRLSRAVAKLRTTDLSVAEIAEESGFHDYNYFLKSLKNHLGTTTKEIRGK